MSLALLRLGDPPTSLWASVVSGGYSVCIPWDSASEATVGDTANLSAFRILLSIRSVKLLEGLANSGATCLEFGKVDFQWVLEGDIDESRNAGGLS